MFDPEGRAEAGHRVEGYVRPEQPPARMEQLIVAIDVDGTLVTNVAADIYQEKRVLGVPYDHDVANREIAELLVILSRFKNIKVVVWSGGGKEYAESWVERLRLNRWVWKCAGKSDGTVKPDIAIDDVHDFNLGGLNLIVRQK